MEPGPSHPSVRLAASLASCIVLLAAATGCGSLAGEDEPSSATDPSSRATGTPSSASDSSTQTLSVGDTVKAGQALIVSTSNVDEPTTRLASALVDEQAVETFVADSDARLADDVRAAFEDVQVPEDSTLFGSVVAVGCDKPVAVSWQKTSDGIEATAQLPKSGVQCLVPVTSVALFLVADSA